jgi:hypothetical protein
MEKKNGNKIIINLYIYELTISFYRMDCTREDIQGESDFNHHLATTTDYTLISARGATANSLPTMAHDGEETVENKAQTVRKKIDAMKARRVSGRTRILSEKRKALDEIENNTVMGEEEGSDGPSVIEIADVENIVAAVLQRVDNHYKGVIEEIRKEAKASKDRLREHMETIVTQIGEMEQEHQNEINELHTSIADLMAVVTNINKGNQEGDSYNKTRTYAEAVGLESAEEARRSRISRPLAPTSGLFCTIDTSRVAEEHRNGTHMRTVREDIEQEMKNNGGGDLWRCMAVTRDPRFADRVRIACRDEEELQRVKEAAERRGKPGARILRDQLYPVKVDNINREGVLDAEHKVLPDAAQRLGEENGVKIAKISWLSRRDNGKQYGSMIIYTTKGEDAIKLLQGYYFHVNGESGYTAVCKPRTGPIQCFNCQDMGHKAFSCRGPQRCGKCAEEGHHHSECMSVSPPKCIPCGGPHESYSKNCPTLYSPSHE